MLSTLFLGVQQWAEALTMWTEYSTERLKQSSVMFALTFGTLKQIYFLFSITLLGNQCFRRIHLQTLYIWDVDIGQGDSNNYNGQKASWYGCYLPPLVLDF